MYLIGSSNELSRAFSDHAELLKAIDRNDTQTQREIARKRGVLPDALVEEVNLIANEILGDILVDEVDGKFVILSDYREEIAALLQE